jgi:hypothetical protein
MYLHVGDRDRHDIPHTRVVEHLAIGRADHSLDDLRRLDPKSDLATANGNDWVIVLAIDKVHEVTTLVALSVRDHIN